MKKLFSPVLDHPKNFLKISQIEVFSLSTVLINEIEQVLDEKVRPKLALHGGNVTIEEQVGTVLKVRMTGTCGNCPAAQLTVQTLIAEEVVAACSQIQDVVLITGVSDSLLNEAKQMLSHNL